MPKRIGRKYWQTLHRWSYSYIYLNLKTRFRSPSTMYHRNFLQCTSMQMLKQKCFEENKQIDNFMWSIIMIYQSDNVVSKVTTCSCYRNKGKRIILNTHFYFLQIYNHKTMCFCIGVCSTNVRLTFCVLQIEDLQYCMLRERNFILLYQLSSEEMRNM